MPALPKDVGKGVVRPEIFGNGEKNQTAAAHANEKGATTNPPLRKKGFRFLSPWAGVRKGGRSAVGLKKGASRSLHVAEKGEVFRPFSRCQEGEGSSFEGNSIKKKEPAVGFARKKKSFAS